MPSLRELGEVEVVRRLTAVAARVASDVGSGIVLGAGDDAAVLAPTPGMELIATTDASVEGRHWRAEWLRAPEQSEDLEFLNHGIGVRLAMANVSDLAAMAAAPRWALLSIGARADDAFETLEWIHGSVAATLAREGAALVGGNVAAVDGPRWFSLTLLGESPRGRAWTRSGARPGDRLAVTGQPGRAAAAIALVTRAHAGVIAAAWAHGASAAAREVFGTFVSPASRVAFALALRDTGGVTAAIDVSDGLLGDLARLCDASGVGATLEESLGAPDAALDALAAELDTSAAALRAQPGDDYELLLAIDPAACGACERIAREMDTPLAFIGEVTDAPDLLQVRRGGRLEPIEPRGFDHFA